MVFAVEIEGFKGRRVLEIFRAIIPPKIEGKTREELTVALAFVVGFAARVDGQLFQLLLSRPRSQELLPDLDPLEVGLTLVGVRAPRRQVLHRGGRKEIQKWRNFHELPFSDLLSPQKCL